ncbi:MAG: amidohydrolase family protein, partial [Acidobacteriota bacterium]
MRSHIFLLAALLTTLGNLSPLRAESLLIQDIRVYPLPGAAPIDNAELWLEHGRIQAVGKKISRQGADTTLDGSSMVALAGFWNCHVHFTEPHWLDAAHLPAERLQKQLTTMLLRHGFTTVVDTGSSPANTRALRSRIDAGLAGPAILQFAGNFVAVGGSPAYLEVKLPELASPEQAKAATEAVLDLGVEGIKIFTGSFLGP